MKLNDLDDLDQKNMEYEEVHCLSNARILWSNDLAIATDFPEAWNSELQPLNEDEKQILRRQFILKNSAIISLSQASDNEVNGPIHITKELRRAARPPRYGRSLVVEAYPVGLNANQAEHIGLLDVKGVGLKPGLQPKVANHKTGILPLPMAFEEIVNQMIFDRIMKLEGLNVAGVSLYALIDLGFEGRIPGSKMLPCAALVREAHKRYDNGVDLYKYGSKEQEVQITLEVVIRRYGFSSVTPMSQFCIGKDNVGILWATYGNSPVEGMTTEYLETIIKELELSLDNGEEVTFGGINIQLAKGVSNNPLNARVVDFGHYNFSDRNDPILSLVSDRILNWGGAFWPKDIKWNNPKHCIKPCLDILRSQLLDKDLSSWMGIEKNDEINGITKFSLKLSRDVMKDLISPSELSNILESFVAEILEL